LGESIEPVHLPSTSAAKAGDAASSSPNASVARMFIEVPPGIVIGFFKGKARTVTLSGIVHMHDMHV
jgi:hypothetical protein